MALVIAQDRIDQSTVRVTSADVLLERPHPASREALTTSHAGDGANMISEGGGLKRKLQELIAQAARLPLGVHIERDQLHDRSAVDVSRTRVDEGPLDDVS